MGGPCAGHLEGEHEVRLEPGGRAWRVTIGRVHVLPQPLGTVLAQLLDPRSQLAGPEGFAARVDVLATPGGRTPWGTSATASACPMSQA